MGLNSLLRKKNINDITAESDSSGSGMKRILGVKDLTLFGIAAIIGAGIFSTIGRASFHGGPAVSLLFVFVAIACIFTALCYAQFASMISVSGSAYTYTYVSLGEVFAWVIGWALILEYAVSNMVIAISWSEYFTTMLEGFGIHWPDWLAIGHTTAYNAYKTVMEGATDLPSNVIKAAQVYQNAPELFGIKLLVNLPAGLIVIILTALVYIGIKESKTVANLLVFLKIGIILLVIIAGAFFVKPENWSPFAPNGIQGVLGGVAAVFFAFIGFDSISTTAEECKNPRRDMPRAMLYCLGICTILYVAIALVLTGMVNFKELGVDDPLAYVFQKVDMNFIAGVISATAIIAITSAILVFQIGQPRIWMTMSRDGLLWPRFSKIHPKFKTPTFATFIAGILVCIPSLFLDMQFVVDLTSVGTFFAFILVCSGVLFLDHKGLSKNAKFKVPYVNGKYIIFISFAVAVYLFLSLTDYRAIMINKPLLSVFWLVWLGLSVAAFKYKFSLLPILGILTNLYLMTELGWSNWLMFILWLAIGLTIYFCYGYKKSKLALQKRFEKEIKKESIIE
ncbi:amino acid permease [Dysgonomonas sp. ZJ279]|uniref:amino acid permease n=1 Tax=Dysgonomonas sp. ZJ279 TaxID=2709796 RepID=UPI0013EA3A41|nr:amino acid permease [Dysgonomonas sp. ZJ279]